MKNIKSFITKHPLTCFMIVVIWVICLIPIPESVPFGDVPMMDKWTHFVMYGSLCAVMWAEEARSKRGNKNSKKPATDNCPPAVGGHSAMTVCYKRSVIWFTTLPALMSGVIELAQAYLTGGTRSGDWLDFAANCIGVVLGNIIGILLAKCFARGKKEI